MAWILLAGVAFTALLGWWWIDSIAALGLVYYVIKEGWEAVEEARGNEDPAPVDATSESASSPHLAFIPGAYNRLLRWTGGQCLFAWAISPGFSAFGEAPSTPQRGRSP